MGYDLHIVRTEQWSDAADMPITKTDIDRLIAADGSLSWSTSDYIDMADEDGSTTRYYLINWQGEPAFWWWRNEVRCKNPSDAQTLEMAQMAAALGAFLVGDDGERYELGRTLVGKPKVIVRNS